MNIRLATINLQVANPQYSKKLYLNAFGMVEDPDRSHPPDFVYLRSDGCDVTLATPPKATGAEPSRTIELGFEVDDMAAMKAHLSASGIRNFGEQSMGWGEAIELSDSDGHRIVVYAFPPTGEPARRT